MSERFFARDEYFMRLALREAELAPVHDDVPIGAVLVRGGEVLAAAHNERELRGTRPRTPRCSRCVRPPARRAAGGWSRRSSTSRSSRVRCAPGPSFWGASHGSSTGPDPKAGAAGSVLDVLGERRLNHRPEVAGGLLAADCGALLSDFFSTRRSARSPRGGRRARSADDPRPRGRMVAEPSWALEGWQSG